ncbi:oligopeptide ABC transporter permease [Desmospora profundinema]|uniref:Oligopeptide transport system permease protein n=1 Tax=Desmospora profundinema TaxID=1571184 RepID=A0ABU1IJH5_9BACL|nr:oligopeptide ABC transporter permease [Desmospora profundinema]MDR6224908.1 oligopeptide transport system permease protein [Desmospora profundinema]
MQRYDLIKLPPGDDLFCFADRKDLEKEEAIRPHISFWQDAFRRLQKNKASLMGLAVILAISFLAVFGPLFNDYGVDDQDVKRANLPPRVPVLEHVPWLGLDGTDGRGVHVYKQKEVQAYFWFGTDELGRDLWTRTWEGTRISLYIAFLAASIDLVIGVCYGSISAYYGGRIDHVMQRVIEVLVGIPNLIIIILLILILKPGIVSITLAMVITGWIGMARIVRGQVLKLKNQEFVWAARALGSKDHRLIWKHLIPNALGPIIITAMFTIPSAIFTEAFLSFIGLGLQPPVASLGTLVNDGYKILRIHPHLMIVSSMVISFIMISFNLLGDGLRDALDPKLRK